MSIFDKIFKKENEKKDELVKYKKHEISPQGEAWISPEAWDNIKTSSLTKADEREKNPHIRGLRPISRDEAESQLATIHKPDEISLNVGGVRNPQKSFTKHCLVTGQNGSGKTTIIKQIMAQTLSQIGEGKDQRAIIYDPKNDFVPFLYGLLGQNAPIKILNPFDKRCVAWDIGKDIQNRAQAATVAKVFVPEPKQGGDENKFFRDGARALIRSVQESFILTSLSLMEEDKEPLDWTLRDLCLALRDSAVLREVLSRHEETAHALEFLDRENNEVLTTAKACLGELEIIAAAWEGKEKFSLKDFRDNKDGTVLVLGSYRESNSPLQILNNVILQRSIQMLLTDSETRTRRSWLFLDEFTSLGKIDDFHTILQEGRSKGVCNVISFQNIEVVRHLYTKEIANAIASECANKIFLKCEGAQAAWVAEFLGKREVWRCEDGSNESESFGINQNASQNSSIAHASGNFPTLTKTSGNAATQGSSYQRQSGKSKNWRIKEEPVITQGDFAMLPEANPKNGIGGFYLTSAVQGVWHHHLDWADVKDAAEISSNESNFESRDDELRYQYLKTWSNKEREKLGLKSGLPTRDELQDAMNKLESEDFNKDAR